MTRRARAGQRARRGGCATLGAASSRRRRSRSSRWTSTLPDLDGVDLVVPHVAQRRRARCSSGCARTAATPARSPARRSPRSGRAPPTRCARTASSPTSCPSKRRRRGRWSRRSPTSPVDARAGRARARGPRRRLRDALRERGAEVDVVDALRDGRRAARRRAPARRALAADWTTFTSASSARFFLEAAGGADALGAGRAWPRSARSRARRCASTASSRDVEAAEHTPDGLVDALVSDAYRPSARPSSSPLGPRQLCGTAARPRSRDAGAIASAPGSRLVVGLGFGGRRAAPPRAPRAQARRGRVTVDRASDMTGR